MDTEGARGALARCRRSGYWAGVRGTGTSVARAAQLPVSRWLQFSGWIVVQVVWRGTDGTRGALTAKTLGPQACRVAVPEPSQGHFAASSHPNKVRRSSVRSGPTLCGGQDLLLRLRLHLGLVTLPPGEGAAHSSVLPLCGTHVGNRSCCLHTTQGRMNDALGGCRPAAAWQGSAGRPCCCRRSCPLPCGAHLPKLVEQKMIISRSSSSSSSTSSSSSSSSAWPSEPPSSLYPDASSPQSSDASSILWSPLFDLASSSSALSSSIAAALLMLSCKSQSRPYVRRTWAWPNRRARFGTCQGKTQVPNKR